MIDYDRISPIESVDQGTDCDLSGRLTALEGPRALVDACDQGGQLDWLFVESIAGNQIAIEKVSRF